MGDRSMVARLSINHLKTAWRTSFPLLVQMYL